MISLVAHVRARTVAIAAACLLLAGCAAANKNQTSSSGSSSSGSSSMAGMNMGGSSSTVAPTVNGVKAVPTQTLASTSWQGMSIKAMAMTPVPFVIFDGTSERMVKPTPQTSFHLMVMLSDAQTGVAIPYATVWATITKGSKVVFDERQWPMISRYMGPHYGNDVSLPGAGAYQLSLLISPPVSARHVEYQGVWLSPHRVTLPFHWTPPT